MNRDIEAISISDLHHFNTLTPTAIMVRHYSGWIEEHKADIIKSDIFFIAGDWFDRGVKYSSPMVYMSLMLITIIGKLCVEHNIKLRILEGTKSHDMDQNTSLVEHLAYACPDLDVKLFKTISVEYIPEWDMNILYVPDDMGTAEWVWKEVCSCLTKAGITKVDMAVMHGCFSYQLPMIQLPSTHDENLYRTIVRYLITIGHHHTFNPNADDWIIPQGSLDRISFGQESPKGGIKMYLSPTTPPRYKFLENKNATPFIKYYLTGDVLSDEKGIRKLALSNMELIHIRLVGPRTDPMLSNIRALKVEYDHAVFTVERLDEETNTLTAPTVVNYLDIPSVNKDNLLSVFCEYLDSQGTPKPDKLKACLQGFIDEKDN